MFIISLGMVIFGLFINKGFPFLLLALFGISLPMIVLTRALVISNGSFTIFRFNSINKKTLFYILIGFLTGLAFAILLRVSFGNSVLPKKLTSFVFFAVSIGALEEILYRGFVQNRVRKFGFMFAVIIPAILHAFYKGSIFVLYPEGISFDFFYLVFWTVSGGIVFGVLVELSDNVLPALAAHAFFDLIVYGGGYAYWWVW